jgi:CopG family nickel-responsive transcriptional regulator
MGSATALEKVLPSAAAYGPVLAGVNGAMAEVVRFSVSTEDTLLQQFDALISSKGYGNRSEAIRDLIRAALVEEQLGQPDSPAVGTVTLIYNHHSSDLTARLADHQHAHHGAIVSTLHIHLDPHTCLEVVVLRGGAAEIRQLADQLISTKGVRHGQFVASATSP